MIQGETSSFDDDHLQSDRSVVELLNNDANVWLVVPTFSGSPPSICGIDGFSEPIAGPHTWGEWATFVASMLKDARTIVQRSIKTPQEARRLNAEFWSLVTTENGSIDDRGFGLLSLAHRDAFLYSSFLDALRGAIGSRGVDVADMSERFTRLAEAAALLSEWASSGNTENLVREQAKRAGRRSGEERRKDGKRDAIEKAIWSLEKTMPDRAIPGAVAQRGIASQRYARGVLRELRIKENRT